jgi:hypothetical protein
MGSSLMNMQILKKSRKPVSVGDIFVYQLEATLGRYYFGKVIRTDAAVGGFKGTTLIYLYKETSESKKIIPELRCTDLLVPPIATNSLPWTKGYFEVVSASSINSTDILSQHCFKDIRGKFFDADDNVLSEAVAPVGEYGLHSYRTIDDAVSKALGIPLSDD